MNWNELSQCLLPGLSAAVDWSELAAPAQRKAAALLNALNALSACVDAADPLAVVAQQQPQLVQSTVAALLEHALRARCLPESWLGVPASYVHA